MYKAYDAFACWVFYQNPEHVAAAASLQVKLLQSFVRQNGKTVNKFSCKLPCAACNSIYNLNIRQNLSSQCSMPYWTEIGGVIDNLATAFRATATSLNEWEKTHPGEMKSLPNPQPSNFKQIIANV